MHKIKLTIELFGCSFFFSFLNGKSIFYVLKLLLLLFGSILLYRYGFVYNFFCTETGVKYFNFVNRNHGINFALEVNSI